MARDFDMVVIGGGAAGLTAAGLSASFGAKTALVEAQKLGGDCTWFGCIPSKALLKSSRIAHQFRNAKRIGLNSIEPQFDFAKVMGRVHEIRERVYQDADAPPNLESLGVEVMIGRASFTDRHEVGVVQGGSKRRISSRYFVVATGSVPAVPKIERLTQIPYFTNETLFSLTRLPQGLIIVGAGPVGIEMAHAFVRLGSRVTVIDHESRILQRDDEELADLLKQRLTDEGIRFILGSTVKEVQEDQGRILAAVDTDGGAALSVIEGDALLVAAGRRPNVNSLNLEAAGAEAREKGIQVDKHCRTSARHIFACGDVTGLYQFTHMSEHMAKVAVSNAVLHLPMSIDQAAVPWCTFTDPELAHVGASEGDLKSRGVRYAVYRFPFSKIDRAVTEGEDFGLVKVFARPFDGKIFGASVLGADAGEMISEFALAVHNGLTLRRMADTIHAYPTFALGNRRAADQWYVRKQSPTLMRWLQRIFRYRGKAPDSEAGARVI